MILCGATTSGCVRATAIDLLQWGWPTLVPRECVGDRAQAPHDANLFDIQAKYADAKVTEAERVTAGNGEVFFELAFVSGGRKREATLTKAGTFVEEEAEDDEDGDGDGDD